MTTDGLKGGKGGKLSFPVFVPREEIEEYNAPIWVDMSAYEYEKGEIRDIINRMAEKKKGKEFRYWCEVHHERKKR